MTRRRSRPPADAPAVNRPGETVKQKSHEELRRLVDDPSAGEESLAQLRRADRKVVYFEHRPEKDRYHSAAESVTILETHTKAVMTTGSKVRKSLDEGRAKRLGPSAERQARDDLLYAWYCNQKKPDSRGRVPSDAEIIKRQDKGVLIAGKYVRLSNRKLDRLKRDQRKP